MRPDGRPIDGKPLLPGDTFLTVAGRQTTPFPDYPLAESSIAATKALLLLERWLVHNALAEAIANEDDFNGRQFKMMSDALSPGKKSDRRGLSPADIDCLNLYLWDHQPKPVPSILKPLAPPL